MRVLVLWVRTITVMSNFGWWSSLLSLPADGLENDDIKLVTKDYFDVGLP